MDILLFHAPVSRPRPRRRARLTVAMASLLLALAGPMSAAEIKGTVVAVTGSEVRIRLDSPRRPQVGEPVVITFAVPGGPELRVGTWRVSQVGPDFVLATVVKATGTPAIGQTATITIPEPSGREAKADGGKGEPSPPAPAPGTPSEWPRAPGPSTPGGPGSRMVNITLDQLYSGPLQIGEGRSEASPGRFVVTSSEAYDTSFVVTSEPAREFHAKVQLRVERRKGPRAVAGLLISASNGPDLTDGDVYFGKDDNQGVLLAWYQGDRWMDIPRMGKVQPIGTDQMDTFEIMRRGSQYEFRLNGQVVGTWTRPADRGEWIQVHTGDGNRAEFRDWNVTRPE